MARSSEILLRKLREALPRYESKRQMAAMLRLHEGTLVRWLGEKNIPNPSLSEIETIAGELGVSVADLLSKDAPPPTAGVTPAVLVPVLKTADQMASAAAELRDGLRALAREPRATGVPVRKPKR